ncbi:hypothetical protein J6590_093343 [Homalodisca vitripennis]|nr:hypothetical protein J6590_093343 [Homalodisca vitripennis]
MEVICAGNFMRTRSRSCFCSCSCSFQLKRTSPHLTEHWCRSVCWRGRNIVRQTSVGNLSGELHTHQLPLLLLLMLMLLSALGTPHYNSLSIGAGVSGGGGAK